MYFGRGENRSEDAQASYSSIRRIPSLNSAFEPYLKSPPIPPKMASVGRKHGLQAMNSMAAWSTVPTTQPAPPTQLPDPSTPIRRPVPPNVATVGRKLRFTTIHSPIAWETAPRAQRSAADPPTPLPRTVLLSPEEYTPSNADLSSPSLEEGINGLRNLRLRDITPKVNRREPTANTFPATRQGMPNGGRVVRSTSLSFHALHPTSRNDSRLSAENSPPPDSGLHSASVTTTPPLNELDSDFRARIQRWNANSITANNNTSTTSLNPQNQKCQRLTNSFVIMPKERDDAIHPPNSACTDFQRRFHVRMWIEAHFDENGKAKII